MTFVNPDTTGRPVPGLVAAAGWGTAVNSALNWLHGDTGVQTVSSFTNGWTASGSVLYWRAGRMLVLVGAVSGGTLGLPAFTLPSAYTPTLPAAVQTRVSNTVTIDTTGRVTPLAGSGLIDLQLIVPLN